MNILDIILIVFIGLFVIRGFMKGFIISLATLLGLVLGIFAAVYFSGLMSTFLAEKFHPSATWLHILSFSLTFLLVLIGVLIIGKLVEKAVDLLQMGLLNKIAGGLFGLLKGVIITSILLFIITGFDTKQHLIKPVDKQNSVIFKPVCGIFPWLINLAGSNKEKFKIPKLPNSLTP